MNRISLIWYMDDFMQKRRAGFKMAKIRWLPNAMYLRRFRPMLVPKRQLRTIDTRYFLYRIHVRDVADVTGFAQAI